MRLLAFATQAPREAEEVRRALERVLESSELRRAAAMRRVARAIEEFFESLLAPFGLAGGDLVWLVALVLALALVWILARALWRRRRAPSRAAAEVASRREARLAELVAQAEQAFARGEHALALRAWICALLVGLGERGELDYRDAWTLRELVERGRPREDLRAHLAPWVEQIDAASFGGRAVGPAEAARARSFVETFLGGERA